MTQFDKATKLRKQVREPVLTYAQQRSLLLRLDKLVDNIYPLPKYAPEVAAEILEYFKKDRILLLAEFWERDDLHPMIRKRVEANLGLENVYLPLKTFKLPGYESNGSYDPQSIAISTNGECVVAGNFHIGLLAWDVQSGNILRKFGDPAMGVCSLVFSPDSRYLLVGYSDNVIRLWEANSGKLIQEFVGHTYGVFGLAFSPDGLCFLSCTSGGQSDPAILWDIKSGKHLREFPTDQNGTFSVCFAPDGQQIFTGNYTVAQMWDLATGQPIRRYDGHENGVDSVAVTPDGRYLLTTSYMTVRLWLAQTGQQVKTWPQSRLINRAIWSANVSSAFVCGSEGIDVLHLWSGEIVDRIYWPRDHLTSIATTSNAKYIATGSNEGIARLWRTND
ncbi:MAG: WD40 repeat domain-containing protein [Aggregatilineales bacterium]